MAFLDLCCLGAGMVPVPVPVIGTDTGTIFLEKLRYEYVHIIFLIQLYK
jgi:hypothetical protein